MTHRPARLLASFALVGALALTGCGDDKDDKDAKAPAAAATDGPATGSDTGDAPAADGDEKVDLDAALDAMGPERKGDALVSATGGERYEVDGNVIHLYLGDSARVPEGTECMIVSSVLSDGESAVVHRGDGTEVTCD